MHTVATALLHRSESSAAGVRFDDRVTGKLKPFPRPKLFISISILPRSGNVVVDIRYEIQKILTSLLKRLQPDTGLAAAGSGRNDHLCYRRVRCIKNNHCIYQRNIPVI